MTKHSHSKMNFGRSVEGCPRCDEIKMEKAAAVQPKIEPQTATPVPPTVTGQTTLTGTDIAAIIREARAPDPAVAAEESRKKAALKQSKAAMITVLEQARQAKLNGQRQCGSLENWREGHRKIDQVTREDKGTGVTWKRHANGFATGICCRCNAVFGWNDAGEMTEPANLHPEAGGVISGQSYEQPAAVAG